MKEIKLLQLFPDAMGMYGDRQNLRAIRQRVREMGLECNIYYGDENDLSIDGYDLIYIGNGSTKNLLNICNYLTRMSTKICAKIEGGQMFFVSGSSRLLFGRGFVTSTGETRQGVGMFDYSGICDREIFISNVISTPVFDELSICLGDINRCAHIIGENRYPLFNIIRGGSDDKNGGGYEGTLYKNFFGTWQTGAVIARNPALMREILRRLTGSEYREGNYILEQRAINRTILNIIKEDKKLLRHRFIS